jgi:oligopeptide transport system substrate-binding protein
MRARPFLGWTSAVALALLVQACSGDSDRGSARSAMSIGIHRSVGGEPVSLDPQRVGDTFSFEVLRDLFEGLTAESASGEVVPGMADRWSVTNAGKTYQFRLRRDGKWSNGEPISADDFVRGLRRAVDPAVHGPNAELLTAIRGAPDIIAGRAQPTSLGVAAPDPWTVEIELSAPAPYFPAILSNAVAYPAYRQATEPGAQALVSNGAYRLVRWTPGNAIELERNPYYWDAASVLIPRVDYVAISDSNVELLRYRAGQLDMTSFLPSQQLESLRQQLPAEVQVRAQLAVVYYVFNLDRGPLRESARLREALSLAIDREKLSAAVLKGGQVAAYGFVPPGIQGYEGPAYGWRADGIDARLARAVALYRASGYSAARPLRLRILCPEDDTLRRVALAVSAMWHEALGVEVTPTFMEYRAFLAARSQRGEWDVVSDGWNADYPDPGNFLGIFASRGAQNTAGFADPEFDRLMSAVGAEADGARRLALLATAESRLLEAYPIAPLYFAVSRRLVKPRIEGAVLSPMNHNYSKYLSLR